MYICKLKSLATTGTLENGGSVSKGNDSILWSIKSTKLSIPEVGKGKLLSYAASSPGAALPPVLAGAAFAGAYFAGAPLAPPFPPAACCYYC